MRLGHTCAPSRLVLAIALVASLVASVLPASAVLAADPDAGYDVTWTVTQPDATVRTDDRIAVGDDLALTYQAVDGTQVTACRIRLTAFGGGLMESPGAIVNGTCRLSIRLPDFPDPAERAPLAPDPDSVGLDLCVWTSSITFADGLPRLMAPDDRTQPGGRVCNNFVDGSDANVLDFRIDPTGTRRTFQSTPTIVSWDPADWGTGMVPMRFGEDWRFAPPAGLDRCRLSLNGSASALTPRAGTGCQAWDLRLPGVLPATLPWADGGGGDWQFQMLIDYTVTDPGPGSWTVTHTRAPLASSDGVFQSSLAAIFPTDLASARFTTAGERWQPTFRVSGATASNCRLTRITIPPTWPVDAPIFDDFDVAPDGDGVCTFDLDPLAEWEQHQYWVRPTLTSNHDPNLSYGADILGIPAPQPPVIDPPIAEPDGETGIDVEPGDGQGLAVDLEVVATAALSTSAIAAAAPLCADRSVSANLETGGSIPRLKASCGLAPGTYRATATMVDAAGVVVTSLRTFTVLAPRPLVARRYPAPGATGIARDVKPTVVFDMPVTGVTASSFRLRDTLTGAYATSTVRYSAATRRATLTPSSPLIAGRTYRLYLTSAIKSAASGRRVLPIDWTFRISKDVTRPTIVGRLPASGAIGVVRTSNVIVRFSESVRGVTTSTFQLRDTVKGLYVPAAVSYDAATRRATLDPSVTLVGGRRYLVIVRYGIRDKAGISVMTSTWSLTTRR